jgi:hypothetical protein
LSFKSSAANFRAERPLHVVAPADAVDVGIAAVGDLDRRVRRRDHRQHAFLVNVGRGERDAGVEVADDQQYVGVGQDVARVGDADLGLRLVVVRHEHEIVAERLEALDRLLDGELRAELDRLADRRLLARERRLGRDFDAPLLCPRLGRGQGGRGENGKD